MATISGYAVRQAVALTDRVFVASSSSDAIQSATLSQVLSLGAGTESSGASGPVRPALTAFTESNGSTYVTATDIANGPILIQAVTGQPYLDIVSWQQAVSGSEWMVTGCIASSAVPGNAEGGYPTVGLGLVNSAGVFVNFRSVPMQGVYQLAVWSNDTTFDSTIASFNCNGICKYWYRIYYNVRNASFPFSFLLSQDGFIWSDICDWSGSSVVPAPFVADAALFYCDQGGNTGTTGGLVYHWDIEEGTGSSLNPYAAVLQQ
jgi:hypothetical protein